MKLVIKGRPASKKNSRRHFGHLSLPSLAFLNFQEAALWQLKGIKQKYTGPVRISYTFLQKGKMRQDVDNAICSINDVLQESGILADDDLVEYGLFKKIRGCKDWETQLEIEEL